MDRSLRLGVNIDHVATIRNARGDGPSRNASRLRRVTNPVMYTINGSKIRVPIASCQFKKNIETMIPPRVRILVMKSISPFERTLLIASESLVTRLMRSPTLC